MNLVSFRKKTGKTQTELEALSGVKQATISKIERGDSEDLKLSTARKLVAGLKKAGMKKITLDLLFPENKNPAA